MEEALVKQIWEALLGGGVAGGVIGLIVILVIKTWLTKLVNDKDMLCKEIADLKDNRIHRIEKTLEEHIANDATGEVVTELKHINGNLSKINDKVDRIMTESASQQAQINANKLYTENLDKSLQRHKEVHHAR